MEGNSTFGGKFDPGTEALWPEMAIRGWGEPLKFGFRRDINMLSLFRTTGRLFRRLAYAFFIGAFFVSSAAVGAIYRDTDPAADWKTRVGTTIQGAREGVTSRVGSFGGAVRGLLSDLKQLAVDLQSSPPVKTAKARARVEPPVAALVPVHEKTSDDGDPIRDLAVDGQTPPLVKLDAATLSSAETSSDPLGFLNAQGDCSKVRAGMAARYGTGKSAEQIADPILREEFRHVFDETCSTETLRSCRFEWCDRASSGDQMVGTISGLGDNSITEGSPEATSPDGVGADSDRVSSASSAESPAISATGGSDEIAREVQAALTDKKSEESAPSSRVSEHRSPQTHRARLAGFSNEVRGGRALAHRGASVTARTHVTERSTDIPASRLAGIQNTSVSPEKVVAKHEPRRPSPDSLASPEIPQPVMGRLKLTRDMRDEPDQYDLIMRRGQAARDALRQSEGTK